jgi:hypothetical protein
MTEGLITIGGLRFSGPFELQGFHAASSPLAVGTIADREPTMGATILDDGILTTRPSRYGTNSERQLPTGLAIPTKAILQLKMYIRARPRWPVLESCLSLQLTDTNVDGNPPPFSSTSIRPTIDSSFPSKWPNQIALGQI